MVKKFPLPIDKPCPQHWSAKGDTSLGTGIFLALVNGEKKKVLVPRILYETCRRRGRGAIAFRWIPESSLPFDKLELRGAVVEKSNERLF